MIRKRFRKKDSPENISALLSVSMPKGTINRMKFEKVRQNWSRIVGSRLASKSRVVSMEDRKISVCASSPPAAQHIQMKSRAILSVLQKVWNLDIDGIRVFVGNVNSGRNESSERGKNKSTRIRVDQEEVRKEAERIQDMIGNSSIASSIASLKVTCKTRFGNKK